jgi:hypothetical protein
MERELHSKEAHQNTSQMREEAHTDPEQTNVSDTDQTQPGIRPVNENNIGVSTGPLSVHNKLAYQRLPHPLSQLLKEVPVVDGLDVLLLWDFLLKIIQTHLMGQLNPLDIYDIIYPYCRGEMFVAVTQAIRGKENFDGFHARILKQFVPTRQLVRLRLEKYERVQNAREQFTVYIQAIKDAAALLRIEEREEEMVTRIVDGLSPTLRARLVFQQLPSSFAQLDRLVVVERNVAYADCLRTPQPTNFQVGRVDAQNCITQEHQAHKSSQRNARLNRGVVCYFCNKPGHIQRDCFKHKTQLKGQGQSLPNTPL